MNWFSWENLWLKPWFLLVFTTTYEGGFYNISLKTIRGFPDLTAHFSGITP